MKKILVTLILSAAFFASYAYSGEHIKNGTETTETFIRSMLKEHLSQIDNVFWFDNEAILEKYFDKELTSLFLEDQKCHQWTDELCSLDFDPIINAQDYDKRATTKMIIDVASRNGVIIANVIFDNISPRTIIFKIKKTDNGLRISDIQYGHGTQSIKQLLLENIMKAKRLKSNNRLKLTAALPEVMRPRSLA